MTRRLCAVALSALLLLAGCGDGGSPTATTSPTPSPTPLTATQAKAIAAAGILTTADLPGYKAEAEEEDPDQVKDAKDLATCLGVTHADFIASDPGRSFTKGTLEITSSVNIADDAGKASAELAAYDTDKGTSCLKTQASKGAGKEGLTIKQLNITRTPTTVPGADGAFGFTIDASATSPDGTVVAFQGYELGALVGQAELSLSVFSLGPPAITLAEATALLTKSVDRVKTAS